MIVSKGICFALPYVKYFNFFLFDMVSGNGRSR